MFPTTRSRSSIATHPLETDRSGTSRCARERLHRSDSGLHPAHRGSGSSCRGSVCDRTGTGYEVGQRRLRPQLVPSGHPALHSLDSKKDWAPSGFTVRTISLRARLAGAICLKGTWPRTPSICRAAYPADPTSRSLQRTEACYPALLPTGTRLTPAGLRQLAGRTINKTCPNSRQW
jgi:hypothetical protein